LQVVSARFKGVLYNREHRIIPFGIEDIACADKHFGLIRLRARLIKALRKVVQVKSHEIDDAPARNAQPLSVSYLESRARIARHDLTFQDTHPGLLQNTPAKRLNLSIMPRRVSIARQSAPEPIRSRLGYNIKQ